MMADSEAIDKLRAALLAYDTDEVERQAQQLVQRGGDAASALDSLTDAIRDVGRRFETGEVFLPELMMAADAMQAGAAVLTPALPTGAKTSKGTVVIGAVKGDVHDIGKMIVGSMLSASGFKVVDVGVDVSPATFAEAAARNAADIIAVTAIMATTLFGQRDVIDYLDAIGARGKYKVMVGGASCTRQWADEIGADGYGRDAAEAAVVASELIG